MSIPNKNTFRNVLNSKKFAYLLGFLWADGYIAKTNNSIEINIIKEDYLELEQVFHTHIDWNIFYKQRKTKSGDLFGRPQVKIQKSLPELKSLLYETNYQNKSNGDPYNILSQIPIQIHNYWWRGYFDGDGSIAISKNGCRNLSFWSTKEQNWTSLSALMTSLNITFSIYTYTRKCGNSSSLTITHKEKIRKFYNYIYPNEFYDFGLKRKFIKFSLI